MWEWLISPIDAARAHDVGFEISWHARTMVVAWGILAPLAVLIARFFKILPGQKWPQELDSQAWWHSHWMGQTVVVGLTIFGLGLVMSGDLSNLTLHHWLGYGVVAGMVLQVLLGVFRGSKGGPTAPGADGALSGHHYDMTPWRLAFERLHKTIGYGILLLAMITILLGLWDANGPVWMWLVLVFWWAGLIAAFIALQKRGMAVDTYQAIWGDDPSHPGNRLPAPGWGVRRPGDQKDEGDTDVRRDRGDGVRSH